MDEIKLSPEEMEAFVQAIANTPLPNQKLLDAAERYKKWRAIPDGDGVRLESGSIG